MDIWTIPDNPYFLSVPAMGFLVMIIVTPEMHILEKKTFNLLIIKTFLTFLFDQWKVPLVNYFIGLKVEQPVSRTIAFCYICLVSMFHSTRIFFYVPYSINNPDLVTFYTKDFFP